MASSFRVEVWGIDLLGVVLAGGDVLFLRLDRGAHRAVDLVPDVAPAKRELIYV